jgi:putative Mn2+ efflux pump MntP
MWKNILIYGVAIFLVLYGLRSIIAALRNEKKTFWVNFGYDTGLRKLFKDKYDKYLNLFGGALSFILGICILIAYTFKK